jgi:TolA-binding protein
VRRLPILKLLPALLAAFLFAPEARAQGFGGTVSDILVRGDSLLFQKRPNEAIVQYQEARTLCPTPFELVQSLQGEARGNLALGQILPAAGLFEEAATRFPDDPRVPDLLYAAGLAREKGGEVDRAIDLLRRALGASPTPDMVPAIRFHLAQALRSRARPKEAAEVLKDMESDFPEDPNLANVLYSLAIAYHDMGDLERSEAGYRSLMEKFPQKQAAVEAHFELASVLADRGKVAEAADLYQKYASLNPASPVVAASLERAADLLLLRSPKQSAQLYALARVKAKANPEPPIDDLRLTRWLPAKEGLAQTLSRGWVVALLGIAVAVGLFLLGRRLFRRRRGQPQPVQV